VTFF